MTANQAPARQGITSSDPGEIRSLHVRRVTHFARQLVAGMTLFFSWNKVLAGSSSPLLRSWGDFPLYWSFWALKLASLKKIRHPSPTPPQLWIVKECVKQQMSVQVRRSLRLQPIEGLCFKLPLWVSFCGLLLFSLLDNNQLYCCSWGVLCFELGMFKIWKKVTSSVDVGSGREVCSLNFAKLTLLSLTPWTWHSPGGQGAGGGGKWTFLTLAQLTPC